MEVVGAIASVGAILGGTQKTLAIIWSIPGIADDWRRLKDEITALRAILVAAERQFPPNQVFESHTIPVQSALERLKDLSNELQALSNRVTKETNDPSSSAKTYKPSRVKWLFEDKFTKKIPTFLIRLQDAKSSLNLALTIAQGWESLAERVAMTRHLQNIQEKFAIMTIQTQALPDLVQQMQQLQIALQGGTQAISQRQTEDIANRAMICGDIDVSQAPEIKQEVQWLTSSCTRFCVCRCHGSSWLSRVRCDHSSCRGSVSSRQATWNVDLGRWLKSYGVSISISASIRPNAIITFSDSRFGIILKSRAVERDLILPHFSGVHPMDTSENAQSVLELALIYHNIVLLEVLISLWKDHFQQNGLNRLDSFRAQSLRWKAGLSEKESAVVSKLISYSDADYACQPTALHLAVVRGDIDGACKAVASDSSLVSMCDAEGFAAIHLAVRQEALAVAMLTMLKGAGAELEQRAQDDMTPLMIASWFGNLEAVRWLLRQGEHVVDPKLRDAFGCTVLHHAVLSSKPATVDIAKLLVAAGAQPSTLDKLSRTPLHLLAYCRGGYAMCHSKVELLVSAGAKIDSKTRLGHTALMLAAHQGDGGAIRALVDAGASLSLTDRSGRTVLHFAALSCGEDTLSELCRHRTFCSPDADPFPRDIHGFSVWNAFLQRVMTPALALFAYGPATETVCHLFETLYLQSRNFTLQSRVAALGQVITSLCAKNNEKALAQLSVLAEQKEPRVLWQTDVEMQPLRSIGLQIRYVDVADAIDALLEQVLISEECLSTTPWQNDSWMWHTRLLIDTASDEDYERQYAFACRMREEGLARWRRWNVRKTVGDYIYTAEDNLPPRPRMMWRLMRTQGRSRGKRTRRRYMRSRQR